MSMLTHELVLRAGPGEMALPEDGISSCECAALSDHGKARGSSSRGRCKASKCSSWGAVREVDVREASFDSMREFWRRGYGSKSRIFFKSTRAEQT